MKKMMRNILPHPMTALMVSHHNFNFDFNFTSKFVLHLFDTFSFMNVHVLYHCYTIIPVLQVYGDSILMESNVHYLAIQP
jgi:hypothetical protein